MTTQELNDDLGRYHLIEKIGAGGMGTVYRARDKEIERDVALKWLPAYFSADKAFVERFRREARVIARLEHPHIVPIYDVGDVEGRPYIIMRLLTGGTLRERANRPDFDLYALMQSLSEIASALESAHKRKIIHRDIKPGNILFDDQGATFLSDFGIAKVLDAATQLTGSGIIGTPAYMSPEQFIGQGIDGRSDEYSLAIVAYEILTGHLPFEGNTAQMMYKHLHASPPDIELEKYPVPVRINSVLKKALSKEPDDRYPTVTEFVAALQQVVQDDSKAASMAVLPMATLVEFPVGTADSNTPSTAASQVDTDYRLGLESMARADWMTAATAFGRVLEVDPTYGNVAEFHAQAEVNLSQSGMAAAAPLTQTDQTSIIPPPLAAVQPQTEIGSAAQAVPTSHVAAEDSDKGGVPGWAKIVGGVLLLLLLLGGGFAAFRAMSGTPESVSDESGVVASAEALPTTTNTDGAATEPPAADSPAEANEVNVVAVAAEPTDTVVPTATAVPSATPLEPTAEPAASAYLVGLKVASANLREGPGVVYPVVSVMYEGETAELLATNSDQTWYLVQKEGETPAWLAASVVQLEAGTLDAEIEVAATIPVAPTLTPVPPTLTPVPVVIPTNPPADSGGGGDSGGDSGSNPPAATSPPPVYTAEPP